MFSEVRAVPKIRSKRPNRKKPKLETYRGRAIPKPKDRSRIDKKNYDKAMELYKHQCADCGSPHVEMHHIVFRSQSGRKGYRNLVPLCKLHHDFCHEKFPTKELREAYSGWYAEMWREKHELKYGPFFAADKFDLYKANLISNTTDEAFERFMEVEEVNACGKVGND
ncbi:HNH endonuclease [Bacillus solitudinis]|uniref:HNH endonuclease n=1 Tax=Bacillus solitudinis TaxID=2014074 RepID=UPI000C249FA4|nr:HNH endonuclease [Bacillus solitudinis]